MVVVVEVIVVVVIEVVAGVEEGVAVLVTETCTVYKTMQLLIWEIF